MKYRAKTARGYNLFEVASCLQKAIRRAEADLAGYMAIELFESGFAKYCWKRLLTISAEDCADIITQEIKSLYDSWLVLNEGAKKERSRIFISKAVLVLCAARKCRDADHLQNYIYDRQLLDAKRLTRAIDEARQNPENLPLPEYTYDVHTAAGKHSGKTKDDFFLVEYQALKPRQLGLFDLILDPDAKKHK